MTNTAEAYDWGDGCKGYPLVSTQEQSIIYETMPPGTSEKYHYHKSAKQFFFILEGRARFANTLKRDQNKAYKFSMVKTQNRERR